MLVTWAVQDERVVAVQRCVCACAHAARVVMWCGVAVCVCSRKLRRLQPGRWKTPRLVRAQRRWPNTDRPRKEAAWQGRRPREAPNSTTEPPYTATHNHTTHDTSHAAHDRAPTRAAPRSRTPALLLTERCSHAPLCALCCVCCCCACAESGGEPARRQGRRAEGGGAAEQQEEGRQLGGGGKGFSTQPLDDSSRTGTSGGQRTQRCAETRGRSGGG